MKMQEIKKFIRENNFTEPLRLNKCSMINDVNLFFQSHIATIDNPNTTKRIKMIHYERLLEAINIIRKKGVKNMAEQIEIRTPLTSQQKNKDMNNDNADSQISLF